MMDKDILSLIAFDLSERRPDGDAWRRVAFGELDAEVLVAERRGVEPEEELEWKRGLFSPSGEEARTRMRDDLRQRFYSSSPETDPVEHDDSDVVPLRKAHRSRGTRIVAAVWGGLLAVAAAFVLMWIIAPPDLPAGSELLAAYEIRLTDPWSGGMRSATAGAAEPEGCVATYHRDLSITVRLHPQEPTHERVAVATWARSEAGESRPWPAAPPLQGADGVLMIQRKVAEIGLEPGVWVLTFYITRAGERFDPQSLETLTPGTHPGVTVVATTVCIEG